jgi:hypothetical protein
MSIDVSSITNIQDAMRAYAATSAKPVVTISDSIAFQSVMRSEMNKFAGMTPQQILDHITVVRRGAIVDSVHISQPVGTLSSVLQEQESVVRKSLSGAASLTDVMKASNEATNALKTAVKVRDQMHALVEKVFSMQI